MGSFYLSPQSALIFVIASCCWLALVGVAGWYWTTSYVPWDWPGGINWRRVLVGSLVQGFFAAQVPWFAVMATHLNHFFVSGPPLPLPHPAVTATFRLVTGPYWLALSVFRDAGPLLAGAVLINAGLYLVVNSVGQLIVANRRD